MEARLTIVGGKTNKKLVTLKLPTVIGRSREADLTIAHPMVSRQHCELFEVQGLVRVRDLGSLNGTFIGEKQISEAALRPNDEFTIGPLTFRVDYEYAGEVTAVAPSVPEDQDGEPSTVDQPAPAAGPAVAAPVATGFVESPPPFFGEALEVEAETPPDDGAFPDFSAWGPPVVQDAPSPVATLEPTATEPPALTVAETEAPAAEGPRCDQVAAETVSPADFAGVDEPARPAGAEAGPAVLAPAADAEPSGKPAPQKKSGGWWPFGRGKRQKRVAATPDKPPASAGSNGRAEPDFAAPQALEATASEIDRETLSEPGPDRDTPMPGAPPRIAAPPRRADEDALDPELDAFLRSFE